MATRVLSWDRLFSPPPLNLLHFRGARDPGATIEAGEPSGAPLLFRSYFLCFTCSAYDWYCSQGEPQTCSRGGGLLPRLPHLSYSTGSGGLFLSAESDFFFAPQCVRRVQVPKLVLPSSPVCPRAQPLGKKQTTKKFFPAPILPSDSPRTPRSIREESSAPASSPSLLSAGTVQGLSLSPTARLRANLEYRRRTLQFPPRAWSQL